MDEEKDDVVEPAEIDLKKSIPLNDADEPDELPHEEDDLLAVDPLLVKDTPLEDEDESLDDLAAKELDDDDDFAEEDEW